MKLPAWITENVPPIMVAILFWISLVALSIIGIGASKGNPLADVATILGGFGQLFFAGAVFLLSRQQFSFTKQVAERQGRIDTYQLRRELFRQYEDMWQTYHRLSEVSDDFIVSWAELADDITRVFSAHIGREVGSIGVSMAVLRPDSEWWHTLFREHEREKALEEIELERDAMRMAYFETSQEMHNHMRLEMGLKSSA